VYLLLPQYNVSWEDPRVDCDLMKLNKKSSILMLTSAGCNVLDYVIDGAG
jgi:S-adenosylmethionine-diacylglycerol 3-amino-3-carboxypropyl transferase